MSKNPPNVKLKVDQFDTGGFLHSKLDEMGLDVYEFRVYMHLCRRVGDENRIWEGQARMGKICKISRTRVNAALKTLEARGLILQVARKREDNSRKPNDIYLLGLDAVISMTPRVTTKTYPPVTPMTPPVIPVTPSVIWRIAEGIPSEGNPSEVDPEERTSSEENKRYYQVSNPPEKSQRIAVNSESEFTRAPTSVPAGNSWPGFPGNSSMLVSETATFAPLTQKNSSIKELEFGEDWEAEESLLVFESQIGTRSAKTPVPVLKPEARSAKDSPPNSAAPPPSAAAPISRSKTAAPMPFLAPEMLLIWNANRGRLPSAELITEAREKGFRDVIRDYGSDQLKTLERFEMAVREVAADEFWISKGYGLGNLLKKGRVEEKACQWAARQPSAQRTAPIGKTLEEMTLLEKRAWKLQRSPYLKATFAEHDALQKQKAELLKRGEDSSYVEQMLEILIIEGEGVYSDFL